MIQPELLSVRLSKESDTQVRNHSYAFGKPIQHSPHLLDRDLPNQLQLSIGSSSEQPFGKTYVVKNSKRIAQIQQSRQKCQTEAPRLDVPLWAGVPMPGNFLNQDLINHQNFHTYADNKAPFGVQQSIIQQQQFQLNDPRDQRRVVTILDNQAQSFDDSTDLGDHDIQFQPNSIFEAIQGQSCDTQKRPSLSKDEKHQLKLASGPQDYR